MADLTYFVGVLASAAGANKRHITIWNGSVQEVRILSVKAAGAPISAVTGQVIPLYATKVTTLPTGGSVVTPSKADSTNPNVPASIQCLTGATGGALEETSPFGVGVVSGEETSFSPESSLYEFGLNGAQPIILRQNEGIVVRQGALASAGAINLAVCASVRT